MDFTTVSTINDISGTSISTGVLLWIIGIIAYWKLFTKAGEAGWKAIIPVYSEFKLYDLTWKGYMLWILVALAVVSALLLTLTSNMFLAVIGVILNIIGMIISIIAKVKLSKAYGHGVGFAIGLIFFFPIFILILGFGKSEYVGPQN